MKKPSIPIALFLTICVYTVGIIGMYSSYDQFFYGLSPLNLLLALCVLIAYQEERKKEFWLIALVSFSLGMLSEILGVATGLVFGNYHYGDNLGPKLMGVPLMIGANWFLLTCISAAICEPLRTNKYLKISLAAGLMVFFDFFIEPSAPMLDFWYWKNNIIPLQNYIAWYLIAWCIHALYFSLQVNRKNNYALGLYCIQVCFFALLLFK